MKKLVTGCTCVVAAFALLTAGCDEPENTLTAAERELIDTANSGISLSDKLVTLATDEIIQDGTGGSIKSIRGKAEAPTAISFSGTVSVTIDLDADDGLGGDAFPYWTGIVDITASGSVIDNGDSGSVTYTVDIYRTTDITVTNQNAAGKWTSATAAEGAGLQFVLDISWTVTDVDNCLISISFDAARSAATANALPLTIVTPAGTVSAELDEAIHNALTLGASGGELVFSASVSGHREVTWTAGAETHTVRVAVDIGVSVQGATEVTIQDSITVTVDGVVFGPYTALEFLLAILFAQ